MNHTQTPMISTRPFSKLAQACTIVCAALLAACAGTATKNTSTDLEHALNATRAGQDLAQLSLTERIQYFTDQVYLAATHAGDARARHQQAAAAALKQLEETLTKQDFLALWIGVDPAFFGRVNAVVKHPDYTQRRIARDGAPPRTVYRLTAKHLDSFPGTAAARKKAMAALINLAGRGDGAACLSFHKAYRGVARPLAGEEGLTWLDVAAVPFRKSMWEGSASARYRGEVVQIAVPPKVVVGCRSVKHRPRQVTAGLVQDAEQFFAGLDLREHFDVAGYEARKAKWLTALRQKAEDTARTKGMRRIVLINVVDVYRVFPPADEYQIEQAANDGSLPELVASGIITEERAFAAEQRAEERRLLLNGVRVTPEDTPLAYLQMVADKPAVNARR
ncbi:MAG TPA: hypothetical protein ENJ19_10015 [Gammaproteobacteria bacterium]|nr:hypothetical protein [Gammaproteobacteria bacterium]